MNNSRVILISMGDVFQRRVPKVGETLPSFDDGKITPSRLYVTKIVEVVPFAEASDITVYGLDKEHNNIYDDIQYKDDINLVEAWEAEKNHFDWIFDDKTDYFIRATVIGDVYEDQWFARTQDGGWFSMQIADYMVGARLDSDMARFNEWSDPEHWNNQTYQEMKDTFEIFK